MNTRKTLRATASRSRRHLGLVASLAGTLAMLATAVPARAQEVVSIKGTQYVNGFATKVRCDETDGTLVGRTPFTRSFYFGANCPLSMDAVDNGYLLFSGMEQQLSVGDSANPTPKDALVFSGNISNAPVFGVAQGVMKDTTAPVSERGTISYLRETQTIRSSFVGAYKVRY